MNQTLADQLLRDTQNGYDAIAEHFSKTRQAPWPEVQNLITLYMHPGDTILDVGCGNGRVADLTNTIKASYTGLDMSPELIRIAKTLHPNDTFVVGNMMHTTFADNTFDHVIMVASLHHVPSSAYRLQTLREMARITKPGGMIMMTNWNMYQWRFFWLRLRFGLGRLLLRHRMDRGDVLVPWYTQHRQQLANRYYHMFTARELRGLARKAQLEVIDHYYETKGQQLPQYGAANLVTVLQNRKD